MLDGYQRSLSPDRVERQDEARPRAAQPRNKLSPRIKEKRYNTPILVNGGPRPAGPFGARKGDVIT